MIGGKISTTALSQLDLLLSALAECCKPLSRGLQNGWSIDAWELDEEAIDCLVAAYRESIAPTLDDDIHRMLIGAGIKLDELLFDDASITADHYKTIRADLTELAAAASLVATEDVNLSDVLLANLSKGSRRKSDSGIDVMAIRPPHDSVGQDDYLLILCSVKHTVGYESNMRYELVKSVTREFTLKYVAAQVKVLYREHQKFGVSLDALFTKLIDFPQEGSVLIIAVGAVDATRQAHLVNQMKNLPEFDDGIYHFRHLMLPDLANLQHKVQP